MAYHKIEQKVREYLLGIDDFPAGGARVLLAFSGGPDSTALAYILSRLSKRLRLSLGAVYINHLLRPAAARKERQFCEKFCRRCGIEYFYRESDITKLARAEKTGIEETARNHRYRMLYELASTENYQFIALGHHRDDRVETILFNLLRGSGRAGVAGMPPRRDKIIRPLYDCRRAEILAYLKAKKISYMTDKSNQSLKFSRNRIRHKIVPCLEKNISASVTGNIIRYSDIISAEDEYLSDYALRRYQKLHAITPGGKNNLDLKRLITYDVWLKRRLIMMLLSDAGLFEIEYADVERVINMVDAGRRSRVQVSAGKFAEVSEDRLYVYESGRQIGNYDAPLPGEVRLPFPRLRYKFTILDSSQELVYDPVRYACLDAAKISGALHITGIKPGVRIHPFGRPGSKKAGDFLTDLKYPRVLRDELPILYDKEGIVWISGIEIAERMRITAKTRKIVKVEYQQY